MKPIGPLMVEHRLIERMAALLRAEIKKMDESQKPDVGFLMVAIDFMRTYADRVHHGKEEDILFKALAAKELEPGLAKIMGELIEEHISARKMVSALLAAREKYINGDRQSLKEITLLLETIGNFYPVHIEKEDKHFFYPCLDYFSKDEQDAMLKEFWEFDRKVIHEKYQKVVEGQEQRKA
jgi:hemerythrin-like domain-containing protein